MKIRVMGSKEECESAREMFLAQRGEPTVARVEVSTLYANRAPSKEVRLYIDIVYTSDSPARLNGGQK